MRCIQLLATAALSLSCNTKGNADDAPGLVPPQLTTEASAKPDAGRSVTHAAARRKLKRVMLPHCEVSVPLPHRPKLALARKLEGPEKLRIAMHTLETAGKRFSVSCVLGKPPTAPVGKLLETAHRDAMESAPPGKITESSRGSSHVESMVRAEVGTFILRTEVRDNTDIIVLLVGPVASRDEYPVKEFLDGLRMISVGGDWFE